MQDGVSLWHKRRNSRVFMNKNAIKIVEIIFKERQEKVHFSKQSYNLI